jgi:predicted HTH transcriptional regulator
MVKAVAFPGTQLSDAQYLDSEDISGALPQQYERSFAFLRRNLRHIQGDQGFNSLGVLEVPTQVLEEVLVNALVHRDYLTSTSVRVMIFLDRIEIISPGSLPDTLSVETILRGATNRRNPTLTEHAVQMLPYRGLGTGIARAIHDWPSITFENDVVANQFRVVIQRADIKTFMTLTDQVTDQVTEQDTEYIAARGKDLQYLDVTIETDANPTDQVIDQVTDQVTEQDHQHTGATVVRSVPPQVNELLKETTHDSSVRELMRRLRLVHRPHFVDAYLKPAIEHGLIIPTKRDKPRSPLQRYRLTEAGKRYRARIAER